MAAERGKLRLLSLDGGGIRGLSTLIILQRIMFALDTKVDQAIERPLRPCQFFDLMAGTSTGGLIAIMLGTMRMTIDECVAAYLDLAPKIFPEEGFLSGSKAGRLFKSARGIARFDAAALEREVKRMVVEQLKKEEGVKFDEAAPLTEGCGVVVCATNKDVNKAVRLRSYRSSWEPSTKCTIWQAARATSAAPLYFDSIAFGMPPMSYVDGGLHYNNPVRVLVDEAKSIWKGTHARSVGCIISIGTGAPPLSAVGDRGLEILESVKATVTDTEDTAQDFENELEHMDSTERPAYFRFNVHNMQKIGLEEWKEFQTLTGATNDYLNAQRREIGNCVDSLLRLAVNDKPEDIFLSDLPIHTKSFFGRAKELSVISKALDPKREHRGIVLCGIGGAGKTQLALRYLYEQQSLYSSILWLNAASSETLAQSFASAAGVIKTKRPSLARRQTIDLLEDKYLFSQLLKSPESRDWLLIVDSFDDLDLPDDFIRNILDKTKAAAIVTSQNAKAAEAFGLTTLDVDKLDLDSACRLLLAKSFKISARTVSEVSPSDRATALRIVKVLHGLPLAIEQAGALIGRGIIPLNSFYDAFTAHYKTLMDNRPQTSLWAYEKRRSVYGIFDMLYHSVRRTNPEAAALITLCSSFGHWPIPVSVLEHFSLYHVNEDDTKPHDLEALKSLLHDPFLLGFALDCLEELCVVKTTRDKNYRPISITMHGSICQWRFETLAGEKPAWVMQATYGLTAHLPNLALSKDLDLRTDQFDSARQFLTPLDNCIRLIGQCIPHDELTPPQGRFRKPYTLISTRIAQVYLHLGRWELCKSYFKSAIEFEMILQGNLWPNSLQALELLTGLSYACRKSGDLEEALGLLEAANPLSKRILGADDEQTISINNELRTLRERIELYLEHHKAIVVASTGAKITEAVHMFGGPSSIRAPDTQLGGTRSKRQYSPYHTASTYRYGSPLHIAVASNDLARILDALQFDQEDVYTRNSEGYTALHYAFTDSAIKLLINAGADPNARTDSGVTPLFTLLGLEPEDPSPDAWRYGRQQLIRLMLARIGMLRFLSVFHWEELSFTEVLWEEFQRFLRSSVNRLLRAGADLNARDPNGRTLMHRAAAVGYDSIVSVLATFDADMGARDDLGQTPYDIMATVDRRRQNYIKTLERGDDYFSHHHRSYEAANNFFDGHEVVHEVLDEELNFESISSDESDIYN